MSFVKCDRIGGRRQKVAAFTDQRLQVEFNALPVEQDGRTSIPRRLRVRFQVQGGDKGFRSLVETSSIKDRFRYRRRYARIVRRFGTAFGLVSRRMGASSSWCLGLFDSLRTIHFWHSIPPEPQQILIDGRRVLDPSHAICLSFPLRLLPADKDNGSLAMKVFEEGMINLLLHVATMNPVQVYAGLFCESSRVQVRNWADADCGVVSFDGHILTSRRPLPHFHETTIHLEYIAAPY